jgi:NitT/TauT family transport system substrate-binding protein
MLSMRVRYPILDTISLAAVLAVLAGCGVPSASTSPGAPGQPVKPAQVRLGYFANITHAQALIGVARGDFQKAIGNVPLKTAVFNAGPAAVEALFAGELDFAFVGPGPAVNAYVKSHGEAVRVVAGAAANGVSIVARKNSGITKLSDLKGTRIATPQYGNTQDISARAYLLHEFHDNAKHDGGQTEIQAIANAEQIGLFRQGQLDAAWAPEPWGTRLIHEAGGVLIAEEKDLWPEKRFAITLVLVSKKFLDEHPDLVEAILRAHLQVTEFVRASPDAASRIINDELKRLLGKPLAPEVLKESLARVEFTADPIESSVATFAGWSFELGFSKQKPDLKGLFDLTILKKIQAK